MRLSEIRSETKPVVVSFAAGDLNVVYRPNAFTADVADRMATATKDPDQATGAFFEMISGLLVSWDLEDDAGKVIPVEDTARLRAEVPMPIFGRIFAALQEDQNPGGAARR